MPVIFIIATTQRAAMNKFRAFKPTGKHLVMVATSVQRVHRVNRRPIIPTGQAALYKVTYKYRKKGKRK